MSLKLRDSKHIWHPLTQHQIHPHALGISSASGVYLIDDQGNRYIDGISSWYTAVYGHCNPKITNPVSKQMQTLDQVVFAGFTHEPAVALSEALISILPYNQNRLFFSDNGSTAVDVALKMAIQYHHNQGVKKNVFVALDNGFHGDTFGAMSVSGLSVYNGAFEDFFIDVKRIPVPNSENLAEVLKAFEELLQEGDIAGFIYEPLVQGAAAMHIYPADGICALLKLCKQYNVLKIADEVMTGFGKTGTPFASDQITIKPDIICLSKALTAGLMPMAITTCSEQIFKAFLSDENAKGLFHGHTYTANPLACSAALAAIDLFQTTEIQEGIQRINRAHLAFEAKIKKHPKVGQTRVIGVIFALDLETQMDRYGSIRDQLFQFFMDNGVFLRPLGNTIYILPPYIITAEELQKIYKTIEEALGIL